MPPAAHPTPVPLGTVEHDHEHADAHEELVVPVRRTSTPQIVIAAALGVLALVGALALTSGLVVEAPREALPPAPVAPPPPEAPPSVVESPGPSPREPSLAVSIAPPVDAPMPVIDRAAARAERKEARSALELRDLPRARDAAARAVHLDPEHADGWLLLGAAYLDLHEEWAARRAFASCAKHAKRGPRGECVALIR